MNDAWRLGIDVGGTGVKGNVVDTTSGELVAERVRIETPHPATPEAVADTVAAVVEAHAWEGPVGITLPSVVKDGIAHTAANIDPTWPGTDAVTLFGERLGRRGVHVLNDADAAGLAEVRFGAGQGVAGVVCLLTIGTGIGSAVFHDGELLPSTEFGHLQVDGHDAETRISAAAREREELSWGKWAKRFSRYLQVLEDLIWPDLFILGGGVSKKPDKWLPLLEARTRIVTAKLQNQAGIVGAAMAAVEGTSP
ncbi:polyphosphate--glucose phosphotransferase [Actinomycetospora sp. TBRC 11914]|uniref:polyphosphate--glucose phosphotransferase n=1 Tax=Actinomycetospora sp. TBRC 11914 TaxID=2729387 RepID=UPI00145F608D|nr:ROK family protein [Actinomycetospora sp. TBRC 11914]NMO89793.1 ROK family protein [Actinomycetospora sp. TBRC 11914]